MLLRPSNQNNRKEKLLRQFRAAWADTPQVGLFAIDNRLIAVNWTYSLRIPEEPPEPPHCWPRAKACVVFTWAPRRSRTVDWRSALSAECDHWIWNNGFMQVYVPEFGIHQMVVVQ